MLAPPTVSSATCCTSGEERAQGPLGRLRHPFTNTCIPSLNRISPCFSAVWILIVITLSPPGFGAPAQAA